MIQAPQARGKSALGPFNLSLNALSSPPHRIFSDHTIHATNRLAHADCASSVRSGLDSER